MPDRKRNYYVAALSAEKLLQVYETDIPEVARYLREEIDFVRRRLCHGDSVLEVGTGYGRILKELSPYAKNLVGIDISEASIVFGREYVKPASNITLTVMDARTLDFKSSFDAVLCLQNGLSSLKEDPRLTVRLCVDALVPGGRAYFSTYCEKFWEVRLAWFEEQARKGLLGEIDWERTKDGVIVCTDGFQGTTFSERELAGFGESSGCPWEIHEVGGSSLFLIVTK